MTNFFGDEGFGLNLDENIVLEALNDIIGGLPPLMVENSLSQAAFDHAQQIQTGKITNFHDGFEDRQDNFSDLRRYSEICFIIQKNEKINSTLSELIINQTKSQYLKQVTCGVNVAGISVLPYQTNSYICVIFLAFLTPVLPRATLIQFLEETRSVSYPVMSPLILNSFINKYRDLIHFPPLISSNDQFNYQGRITPLTRKTEACDLFEFFQKWVLDPFLFEILNELWNYFSLSMEQTTDADGNSFVVLKSIFHGPLGTFSLNYQIKDVAQMIKKMASTIPVANLFPFFDGEYPRSSSSLSSILHDDSSIPNLNSENSISNLVSDESDLNLQIPVRPISGRYSPCPIPKSPRIDTNSSPFSS